VFVANRAIRLELLDWQRLARKTRLRDEEVPAGENTDVCRNHVARAKVDDVSGHEPRQRLFDRVTRTQDRCGHLDHGAKLRGRRVCPRFLDEAQSNTEDDHHRHDDRRPRVAGRERNQSQCSEQEYERVQTRAHEQAQARVAFVGGHYVRSVAF